MYFSRLDGIVFFLTQIENLLQISPVPHTGCPRLGLDSRKLKLEPVPDVILVSAPISLSQYGSLLEFSGWFFGTRA